MNRLLWGIGTLVLQLAMSGLTPVTANRQVPLATGVAEVRQLNQRGRFADGERRARELLVDAEGRFGLESLEAASVLDALVESLQQGGKSKDPDTRASAERALLIKETRLGKEDKEVAVTLTGLAAVLTSTGDYAAARSTLQRALAIREKTLGPDHPLTATTIGHLAMVTSEFIGEAVAARPLFERALRITEAADGPDQSALGRLLFNAARNALRRDDPTTARLYFERALSIFEKQLGAEHAMVGNTLTSLAMALQRTGAYADAQTRFEQGIAILEKTVGPDHEWVAGAVNDLGLLMWQLGDYDRARADYDRAFAIWSGKNSAQAAAPLNNLAILARRSGDYVAARDFYDRSLAIKEKAFGRDHVEVALVLHNLANLLFDIGDYQTSQRLFERAIVIRVDKLGPTHSLVASSRYGLATTLAAAGQNRLAYLTFETALSLWRKSGADSPDVAEGLRGLAAFLEGTGQLRQAERRYAESLSIYEKAYGRDHLEVGSVLSSLAALYVRLGALERARSLSARALPILEAVLGRDSPQVAKVLALEADIHLRRQEWPAAIEKALQSEAISRDRFRLTARALSERQALGYADVRASGLDVALSVLASDPTTDAATRRSVHDAAIRSRALVLDEVASRHRPTDVDVQLTPASQRFASAQQRMANILVRGPEGRPQQYRQLLDQAKKDRDAAEEALAALSIPLRDARALPEIGASNVRAELPHDAALVTFIRYQRRLPQGGSLAHYAAFTIRSATDDHVFIPLGAATAVEALVQYWRTAAKPPGQDANAPEVEYRRAAAALRAAIWDPVRVSIADVTKVFVVPDGALNLVTFAALPSRRGQYLVDTGPVVHYVSAERDIVRTTSPPVLAGSGLLIVGNPAYEILGAQPPAAGVLRGTPVECVDFERVRFEALPATGKEVEEITDLWTGSTGSTRRSAEVLRLSGDEAREAAFKREAPGRSILHLATHGFFLSSRCVSTFDNRRGIGGLSLPPAARQTNPLLLAGLALAGANQRRAATTGDEDGILTAEEIAALDLRSVELVVLSACDTGLGEIRAGEGVFGLRRAFRIAGARAVVMSLWPVEDESTRAWMRSFYQRRLGGSSIAESVNQAHQDRLTARRSRKESTHPFYWAGFVAAGDWR